VVVSRGVTTDKLLWRKAVERKLNFILLDESRRWINLDQVRSVQLEDEPRDATLDVLQGIVAPGAAPTTRIRVEWGDGKSEPFEGMDAVVILNELANVSGE
jgi:hypothetical protein